MSASSFVAPVLRAIGLAVMLVVILGPLANLVLWAFTERWSWPNPFPTQFGFMYWERVFAPRSEVWGSLFNSVWIATLTVVFSMLVAIPSGYVLARMKVPARGLIMLAFLLPQAFPNLPIYVNVAQMFYSLGLNGTTLGVVLVHSLHGLVLTVWIAVASFASVDRSLEEAARDLGAGPVRTFFVVSLPAALPGLLASAIFVFLDSLDEFTGTYFVGAPDIVTLPLLMYNAAVNGNYQVASITALILLVPSAFFMVLVTRYLRPEVMAKVGS